MTVGNVKWFDLKKGYGFIQPEDGSKDVFVSATALKKLGLSDLKAGQKVKFKVVEERNGRTSAQIVSVS